MKQKANQGSWRIGSVNPSIGNTESPITVDSITDIKAQMKMIEEQFARDCPITIPIPINPTYITMSLQSVVFSESSGEICALSLDRNNLTRHSLSTSIRNIAYSLYNDCFFASGDVLRKLNPKTFEVEAEYQQDVLHFVADLEMGYGCKEDSVYIWRLHNMQEELLYAHESVVSLSAKNHVIASISESTLVVWSSAVIYTNEKFDKKIKEVRVSNKYIAICGEYQYVLLFEINTWTIRTILNNDYSCMYYSIDIDDQRNVLVAAGTKYISVYDLEQERDEIVLVSNDKKHYLVGIAGNSIYSFSSNSKVRIFEIPGLGDRHILNFTEKVKGVVATAGYLLCYTTRGLQVVDSKSLEVVHSINIEEDIHCAICSDTSVLVVQGQSLARYSLALELQGRFLWLTPIICMCQNESSIFVSSPDSVVRLQQDFLKVSEYFIYKSTVTCISVYNSSLYIGDKSGLIHSTDSSSLQLIKNLKGHTDIVNSIAILDKLEYILSCSDDRSIKIWNIRNFNCMHSVYSNSCIQIMASADGFHFYALNKDEIQIWDSNDFGVHTLLKGCKSNKAFALVGGEMQIAVSGSKNKVKFLRNPLRCKEIQAFGKNYKETVAFKQLILKYMRGAKTSAGIKDFDNWIISPFQINIVSVLAYFNESGTLFEALQANSFHPTTSGSTPLSIALSKNFLELLKIIFRSFKLKVQDNLYCLYYIESTLLELNYKSVPNLHKLYQLAMGKSFVKSLPKFCVYTKALPILLESSSIIPDPSLFMDIENYSNLGKAIVFTQTYIRINTTIGSQESVDFMESLLKCENKLIFSTPLIKVLIRDKWRKVRPVILCQAGVYVVYLIALALYSTSYFNAQFLIFPFVVSSILLIYEVFQMRSGIINYLSGSWNIIDITRAVLFLWYSISVWKDGTSYTPLLSIIILLTWCRGVTYFRIFYGTRYYINLLFQVIKSMFSFFLIFFYSIVGFAMVFHSFSLNQDFFTFVTDLYILDFGQMDTGGYNKLQWLYFLLVTVLNPIIMLNLLISVMLDTYGRVKTDEAIADALELCCMIKEVELLMFWRRNIKSKSYIHICDMETPVPKSLGVDNLFKGLKKVIRDLGSEINNSNLQLMRSIESVKSGMINSEAAINEIKNAVKNKNRY